VGGLIRKLGVVAAVLLAALSALAPASSQAAPIAYRSDAGADGCFGGFCSDGIWRMNEDGSEARRLTFRHEPGGDFQDDSSPAWSPDGQRIAYDHFETNGGGLSVVNADGSGAHRLIPIEAMKPRWSPDGARIVFQSRGLPGRPSHGDTDIGIVNADGTNVRAITEDPGVEAYPTFTPDGRRVLYTRSGFFPGAGKPGLYSIDPDGGAPADAVSGFGPQGLTFSPDGRYLGFTIFGDLYTMRVDGSEFRRHTYGEAAALSERPSWSGDGQSLFYSGLLDRHSTQSAVFRLNVLDPQAKPVQITPPGRYAEPDVSPAGAPRAPADTRAPALALIDTGAEDVRVGASAAASRRGPMTVERLDLAYLAIDVSGLRKVEVAIGKPVARAGHKPRCRFMSQSGRLGRRRSCDKPSFFRPEDRLAFTQRLAQLKPGIYRIGLRATDSFGNSTRRVRMRTVRLR
jgi:dipeptidyl aminopeptidase/acylaminoacyl peptidase